MSDMSIKDGKGKGFSADVDDHGRLYVKSNIITHLAHHATYHKNVYVSPFKTTLSDTSETPILFFQNNSSDKDLIIHNIIISSNANIETFARIGELRSSGGNLLAMVNTNTGVNIAGEGVAYEGGASADLVLDDTNSQEIDGAFIAANAPLLNDYQGAVVLAPTKTLAVYAQGAASNKVKIVMVYTSHPEGTKL